MNAKTGEISAIEYPKLRDFLYAIMAKDASATVIYRYGEAFVFAFFYPHSSHFSVNYTRDVVDTPYIELDPATGTIRPVPQIDGEVKRRYFIVSNIRYSSLLEGLKEDLGVREEIHA